ncbi:hypothetical protein AB0O91_04985 [Kitasatospora sp. NPDC089797]|uniref:hypothetical protein n=1 Tax=Kitasatospora sp. NPDC089797 TaxID=3155298 RepID=UPI0034218E1F
MAVLTTGPVIRDTADRHHRLRHALAVIALSTGLILGVIAVDVYLDGRLAIALGCVYPVTLVAVFTLRRDSLGNPAFQKAMTGCIALMAFTGLFAYLLGANAWRGLILRSGDEVTAVVRSERIEKSGRGAAARSYTLAERDGTAVPGGELRPDSARFRPGDVLTVRVDPTGRVAPELPGETDSPAPALGFLALNAVLDGIILWSVRRPTDRRGT